MSTAKYRGWFGRRAKARCPHSNLEGIYGDPINHVGGWRLLCHDCWRFLDGPVSLAESRTSEREGASRLPADTDTGRGQ